MSEDYPLFVTCPECGSTGPHEYEGTDYAGGSFVDRLTGRALTRWDHLHCIVCDAYFDRWEIEE